MTRQGFYSFVADISLRTCVWLELFVSFFKISENKSRPGPNAACAFGPTALMGPSR